MVMTLTLISSTGPSTTIITLLLIVTLGATGVVVGVGVAVASCNMRAGRFAAILAGRDAIRLMTQPSSSGSGMVVTVGGGVTVGVIEGSRVGVLVGVSVGVTGVGVKSSSPWSSSSPCSSSSSAQPTMRPPLLN